jgi:uncharacterized protein (DUF2384 family)
VKPWEVGRMYDLHHLLLLHYEPHEAMFWLMRQQPLLGNRRPCEALETPEGYRDVQNVIVQMADSVHM